MDFPTGLCSLFFFRFGFRFRRFYLWALDLPFRLPSRLPLIKIIDLSYELQEILSMSFGPSVSSFVSTSASREFMLWAFVPASASRDSRLIFRFGFSFLLSFFNFQALPSHVSSTDTHSREIHLKSLSNKHALEHIFY